jgi:RNA-directed DNA polymerase
VRRGRQLDSHGETAKKRKWYSLADKVWNPETMRKAWERVKVNKGKHGVDGVTIEVFGNELEANLRELHEELKGKTYRPQPVRRVYIPKADGRQRPLGIPTVRDRVVQQAVRIVIEPIFEAKFLPCSYGFRPGRGAHDAIDQVTDTLNQGFQYVVDCDVVGYFDHIPHDRLIDAVAEEISDGTILRWIRMFLESGVMESGVWCETEEGTPQGGVISPLLANIYLHPLDEEMTRRGHRMVRYADDFIILCGSRRAAERVMEHVKVQLRQMGLTVHPEKSKVRSLEEGFTFLSYYFFPRGRRPSDRALNKFKDRVREITRRNQTVPIQSVAKELTQYIRGWGVYFGYGQVKVRFGSLDQWIRRRMRAVQLRSWRHVGKLHHALKRKGWKQEELIGLSMMRWRSSKCPMVHAALDNQWAKEAGLISLVEIHRKVNQSRLSRLAG